MSARTDGPRMLPEVRSCRGRRERYRHGQEEHPWFATFAVLSECIGGSWRPEPTAVGFRGCAPVVAGSSRRRPTLEALDQGSRGCDGPRLPPIARDCLGEDVD